VSQDRDIFRKYVTAIKSTVLIFYAFTITDLFMLMRLLGQYLIYIFCCLFLLYMHNAVVFVLHYVCLCIVLFLSLASRLLIQQVNKQDVKESEINWIIMTKFISVYSDILCSLTPICVGNRAQLPLCSHS
jgi:hypothetical protein